MDVAWTWSEKAQEAFNTLKEKLSEFPILRRPDFNKVFKLHTDWSALGIGVILGQLDDEGKEYVIAQRANRCEQCDRVRTYFSSQQLTLSPLPI